MYCQDIHAKSQLSGHMCDKEKMPPTEAPCVGSHLSCDDVTTNEVDFPSEDTSHGIKKQLPSSKMSFRWKVGPWKPCSQACGGGLKLRRVACFNTLANSATHNRNCKARQPKLVTTCNQDPCNKWIKGIHHTQRKLQ